jgi:hypothetical protein
MKTTVLTSPIISKIFQLKGEELALIKQYHEAVERADLARRYTPALYPQAVKQAEDAYKRVKEKHADVLLLAGLQ